MVLVIDVLDWRLSALGHGTQTSASASIVDSFYWFFTFYFRPSDCSSTPENNGNLFDVDSTITARTLVDLELWNAHDSNTMNFCGFFMVAKIVILLI